MIKKNVVESNDKFFTSDRRSRVDGIYLRRWNVFQNKKGFIGLWTDVFKGFLVGFICGALLLLLVVLKVIPFPISFCG